MPRWTCLINLKENLEMSLIPTQAEIRELFTTGVKYEIPIYQRRYVWDTENWTPLWEDIKENTEYIKNPDSEVKKLHFTGAIVTQEIEGSSPATHEIIDGQQRLTTFQIIFCVIRDLCKRTEINDRYNLAGTLNNLVINKPLLGSTHKLIPTEYDRDAFRAVVSDQDKTPFADSKIYQAYIYFLDNIRDYVGHDYTIDNNGYQYTYKELHNLYKTITTNFSVVLIKISDEESQKIFETLNATGRQLSEFDYLRNDLFLRVGTGLSSTDAKMERQDFYTRYWSRFESPYNEWDDKKQESFLSIFLEAVLGSKIFQEKKKKYPNRKAFNLYRDYSEDLESNQDPEYEIKQLTTYGLVYKKMTTRDDEIGSMMQFYEDLNITEMPPVILSVISELVPAVIDELVPDDGSIGELLKILESYVVRCKLVGKHRDNIYAPIERYFRSKLDAESPALNIDDFKKSLKWPTCDEVKKGWRKIGSAKDKRLVRYILYRIECHKRKKVLVPDIKSELPLFRELESLEHVMPQSWRDKWPLDLDDNATPTKLYLKDLYTREYRKNNSKWETEPNEDGLVVNNERYQNAHRLALRRIALEDSIGNLTPMSEKSNAHLGNHSFEEKKHFFSSNVARLNLVLTREIIQSDSWDAEEIENRSNNLFNDFLEIWCPK